MNRLGCAVLAAILQASGASAQPAAAPPDTLETRPRIGRAIGEMFAANTVVWSFNEYVRQAAFAQVSPRSWRENLDRGWTWDDNDFLTNQFAHPFQGALYYSTARNNGLGFWGSAPVAFLGSLQWECCGETHPMSINDWVNTGMGGVAIGEMTYRASHLLWNSDTLPRWASHTIAAVANPVGTLHRWAGDEHASVRRDPLPDVDLWTSARVGWRTGGRDALIDPDETSGAYFELDLLYGDPDRVERPYDSFRLILQMNTDSDQKLERVQIEGTLASWQLARDARKVRNLQLVQGFDYLNSTVLEAGGQAIGLELREWRRFPRGWNGLLRASVRGLVLAAIDSEFAFLAEVSDPERRREYDFGPGVGATAVLALLERDQLVLGGSWGWYGIETVNGSVYQGENTNHSIQYLVGRAQWPLRDRLAVGAEIVRYSRTTHFDFLEGEVDGEPEVDAHTSLVKFFVQLR